MKLNDLTFIKTFFTFSNKELNKNFVSYWKNCGFNLASTYTFNPKIHDQNKMLELLLEAEKNNIKVLVSDIRVTYKHLKEVGEEIFKKEIKQAYDFYKNANSFIGFFLGDEPWSNEIPYVIKANLLLLNIDKNLLNFVNFFPYCDNASVKDILGCKPNEYEFTLADTIQKSKLKIWGIDHYGILWVHEQERGKFQYYKTVEIARKVAKKTNTKCIFAGNILRHNNISDVNFDLIRYQISISVMNGLDGINWYKLYDTNEGLNSLHNGCDSSYPIDYDGNKTQYFNLLKNANRWLDEKILPLTKGLKFVTSKIYENKENNKFVFDEILVSFISDHKEPLLISKFIDKLNKPHYFAMNLSKDKPEVIIYEYKSTYKNGSSWMLPGEMISISDE